MFFPPSTLLLDTFFLRLLFFGIILYFVFFDDFIFFLFLDGLKFEVVTISKSNGDLLLLLLLSFGVFNDVESFPSGDVNGDVYGDNVLFRGDVGVVGLDCVNDCCSLYFDSYDAKNSLYKPSTNIIR